MQYHYVVYFDDQSEQWVIQPDADSILKFQSAYYDDEHEEWVQYRPTPEMKSCYEEMQEVLEDLLDQ